MQVRDLVRAMETLAPLRYSESWDKVGLLAGDASRTLTGPVLLTIDLSEGVLEEARGLSCSAIVAYHPPIFEPLARVTDATPRQRVILRALEAGIAIYSPHTALDAIPGGVTDWLCEGLSGSTTPGRIAGDVRALTPHAQLPEEQQVKVVTFVQQRDVELVRNALASAGAGRIGKYSLCSFGVEGEGTFFGEDGAAPSVGKAERLEQVREVRLEMVCSKAGLPIALETLRELHPYETPAIDVYPLVAQPTRGAGSGRRLVLDKPATVRELAQRLKNWVKRDRVRYALAHNGPRQMGTPVPTDITVTRIGVVPGSGASLSRLARQEGCELFVTGEMKHHDVLGALDAGMSVLLGGHTNTERGYLPRLATRLRDALPGVDVRVSTVDRDPLESV